MKSVYLFFFLIACVFGVIIKKCLPKVVMKLSHTFSHKESLFLFFRALIWVLRTFHSAHWNYHMLFLLGVINCISRFYIVNSSLNSSGCDIFIFFYTLFYLLIFDLGFYLLSVILTYTFPSSIYLCWILLLISDKMDWGIALSFQKSQSLW